MVQASRAGLRRRLLLHLALVFAHFYVCGSIHLSPDTHKLLNVAAAIPLRYKQIVDELQQLPMPLPAISSSKFSLSSLTPFCAKFTVPEIEANVVPECIRWEVCTSTQLRRLFASGFLCRSTTEEDDSDIFLLILDSVMA
ncbi:hypothetical protein CHC_T00010188001 [Chondrus crispus]|uniref:Secreted protein n=1 Tax=Chondrus crispus TaxID=2769 RepID=R7QQ78_CHOCR|nr:hypothetical protein CHC_T00010188001 [Chondrus crispus]CDF40279.1 hypothetical protein CHC_T00010188001 [Chondrus crispus]|eukprot:XP_005710573.1 hypothetical protein CHC_T00010188001 [Chondrus crispus]